MVVVGELRAVLGVVHLLEVLRSEMLLFVFHLLLKLPEFDLDELSRVILWLLLSYLNKEIVLCASISSLFV